MALCTFGAGVIKINLSPPTSIEGAGPARARASTGCCWGPNGRSSSPTSQWFRRAEFESRNNGRALHKIYLHRVPPLGRTIICDCGVREFFYGDSGGNRGGNSGGNGDGNGDDGAFNGSNPFGNIFIIYCQMRSRGKLAVNRALFCLLMAGYLWQHQLFSAVAKTASSNNRRTEESPVNYSGNGESEVKETAEMLDAVWEVKGGQWRKLLLDLAKDKFVTEEDEGNAGKRSPENILLGSLTWCRGFILRLMLPEGYPDSVTSDFLEYSLWRVCQGIASQMNGVLTTQALLYAVGLGKGAIPTAAAVNWVLKDGIGYLSKILLSKYGRHFDVHPKGWRLFADVLENTACGMELLTPAFPHLFVYLGAVAGAGRSASGLIQAATRSCFYAGFAAQRNFAEVIAKGEAQGMVSKSLGIIFGIGLSNYAGSSGPLLVASFAIVTSIHMFCNFKSYQAVQLRTLNPYRAGLMFSEYIRSGCIPSVREVNDEEPIFPGVPFLNAKFKSRSVLSSQILSPETKEAAEQIDARLQLGSKFSNVISSQGEADALYDLYQTEQYLLAEKEGKFLVILKNKASPQDMLRAMFQICHLYWLERHLGVESRKIINDCMAGGKLALSHDFMVREFDNLQKKAATVGWYPEGLVARPSPFRVHFNYITS